MPAKHSIASIVRRAPRELRFIVFLAPFLPFRAAMLGGLPCTDEPLRGQVQARTLAMRIRTRAVEAGMAFDLVVKDGMIVDGSGLPRYRADIGVKDGKIAEIGRINGAAAKETLNAEGHVVTPGFVDVHT